MIDAKLFTNHRHVLFTMGTLFLRLLDEKSSFPYFFVFN